MDRKQFITQCGLACMSAAGIALLAQGCAASGQVNAPIVNNQLQVPLTAFRNPKKDDEPSYKRSIVVRNERLNYPIIIYRNNENDYTALLLRCSHQYNELNVNGELLTCPAHGSEFDHKGNVVTGPADARLRSFQVTTDDRHLYLHLA